MRTRGTPETHFAGSARARTGGSGKMERTYKKINAMYAPGVERLFAPTLLLDGNSKATYSNGRYVIVGSNAGSKVWYGTDIKNLSISTAAVAGYSISVACDPTGANVLFGYGNSGNYGYSTNYGADSIELGTAFVTSFWYAYYFDGAFLLAGNGKAYRITTFGGSGTEDSDSTVGTRLVVNGKYLVTETGTGKLWWKAAWSDALVQNVTLAGFTTVNAVAWDSRNRRYMVLDTTVTKSAILDADFNVLSYGTVPANITNMSLGAWGGRFWYDTNNGGNGDTYSSYDGLNWQTFSYHVTKPSYRFLYGFPDDVLLLGTSDQSTCFKLHDFAVTTEVTE